ncbi:hypothetical protein Micbo1qcDRAFT_164196 [Microdochium bolleyi]|uniref:Uncharacterized protein n=1 Tax=Microdochium bolleyi TaxID=196109 RepID=A0A136J0T3_9PEZI|nr:hypothetical protein Micbo1qcDRAFT_164196 [Microdochium bolleyi]
MCKNHTQPIQTGRLSERLADVQMCRCAPPLEIPRNLPAGRSGSDLHVVKSPRVARWDPSTGPAHV